MCQHFCLGGIILIIVFTIVFAIAVYFNLRQEFSSTSPNTSSESQPRSYKTSYRDNVNSTKTCEPLYFSVTNGERENFVPKPNEHFPIVVQLNYRTKDNNSRNQCNGVAIHTNYILTLAECLIDKNDRELTDVTVINPIQNQTDQNYKITDINIYDENMNHSTEVLHNIGLIKIDKGFEITKRFCTRQLKDIGEELPSVWNGSSLKLATCSNRRGEPSRICVDSIGVARPGDPLIEYDKGDWYLIGLHQAIEFVPHEISIYTNVQFYRHWIANIIQSNKNT